jgi:anaerobic magnesium-protoporphyrin IX monomethyl ester cyclase
VGLIQKMSDPTTSISLETHVGTMSDQAQSPEKAAFNEKEQCAIDEHTAVLDRCRGRSSQRTRNRIALIQPRKGGRPALGLLYIGAYLLDNGFEVKIFEFLDELYPPNVRYNKKIFKELEAYDADFIGIGTISSTFKITSKLISKIHREIPGKTILCGGKHPSIDPEYFLRRGADCCTIWEAEITIVELLDAYNFATPLSDVKGICYLDNDKITYTPQRQLLPMDAILRPAFQLVNYEKYVDFRLQSIPGHYLRSGFIFGSRGCPYKCSFCTTNARSLYRERSIDDLIDEIEWQIKTYNVDGFVVLDDMFYLKEKRTIEFCEKVIARNIKAKYFCHGRVDRAKKETLALMKKAGVLLLAVGVESGSQKILDAMHKETDISQVEHAFKMYREVGMNSFAFIIVGHPQETKEDLDLTRALIEKIKPTNVGVNYYMPMPGTPSFELEISNAKYVVGNGTIDDFTFTTDYPEFSMSTPLDELNRIGDEFQGMSVVNRNMNLFTYPKFIFDMIMISLLHPLVILESFYHRYITKKTNQISVVAIIKDAVQFHKQRF